MGEYFPHGDTCHYVNIEDIRTNCLKSALPLILVVVLLK